MEPLPQSISKVSCFIGRGDALKAVVYVKLHKLFVSLYVVLNMLLQSVDGATGTTSRAEWQDLPLIDARFFSSMHILPDEE
jgi:hypothetical protein